MSLTPQQLKALEALPVDPPRSKLEPYRQVILRWRRQRRSYRKIQQILRTECGVNVSFQALFKFVKLRARPRKSVDLDFEPDPVQPVELQTPATSSNRLSAADRQAQLEFIRSLNSKPVLEEQPKTGWKFDADKPRTINKP